MQDLSNAKDEETKELLRSIDRLAEQSHKIRRLTEDRDVEGVISELETECLLCNIFLITEYLEVVLKDDIQEPQDKTSEGAKVSEKIPALLPEVFEKLTPQASSACAMEDCQIAAKLDGYKGMQGHILGLLEKAIESGSSEVIKQVKGAYWRLEGLIDSATAIQRESLL